MLWHALACHPIQEKLVLCPECAPAALVHCRRPRYFRETYLFSKALCSALSVRLRRWGIAIGRDILEKRTFSQKHCALPECALEVPQ